MKTWKKARSFSQSSPTIAHREQATMPVSRAVLTCEHRTRMPVCGCVGRVRCERDQADKSWDDCVTCKRSELGAYALELNHWRGGS